MTAGDLVRRRPSEPWLGPLALLATALLGVVIVAVEIRPFEAATIDPDAAASVLYFERIAGGTRLEAFVPTTPKPLLTAVYGLTWAIGHDWRPLVWATLLVFGLVVALAGWWFARIGRAVVGRWVGLLGALTAAGFVCTGLVASSEMILEVSRANSLVWAMAGWLVAGLAMTGVTRRPGLAGVALLVAGLARFESLAIVAAAGFALVVQAGLARGGRGSAPSPRTWLVLLGGLALPVACLHDLLLTGDPLFWSSVPARYTELYVPGAEPIDPLEYTRTLLARYSSEWPLVVLAVAGLIALLLRRVWVGLVGLAGLGGGVLILLFVLAARGTYISTRYYEPLDLALLGLAGVGAAGAVGLVVGRVRTVPVRHPPGRVAFVLAAAGSAILALAVAWPPAIIESRVGRELDLVRTASMNLEVYMPRLADLAVDERGARASPGPTGAPLADPATARLIVPSLLRPRIAVETKATLTALGDAYALFVAIPPWPGLHAGQWVYHDRAADRPDALDDALEANPALLGAATATPQLVDRVRGVRLLLVERP